MLSRCIIACILTGVLRNTLFGKARPNLLDWRFFAKFVSFDAGKNFALLRGRVTALLKVGTA